MLIETTKGMIEESRLTKELSTEDIPCGWSDVTTYFLDGEKVKQDVNVRVKEGLMTEAFVGTLTQLSVKDFIAGEFQKFIQDFTNTIGEKVQTRFPELAGMALAFQLPGMRLDIKPKEESK